MKLLLSLILTLGSLLGIALCFLSSIIVNSSVAFIDGLELSIALGLFFAAALIGGLYFLFSTN